MTITVASTVLRQEYCCVCGILFCFPENFEAERRRDRASFYCPNGHGQHYTGKTEADLAREEAARHKRQAEFWQQCAQNRRLETQRARASQQATKGHLTRLRKRVAAGKCPCCAAEFQDLARHIQRQHPDFQPQDGGA